MYSGKCAYPLCGRDFTSKRRRQCCGRSCAAKLGGLNNGRGPWTPDEEMALEMLSGTIPFTELCKRMRTLARRRGWPVRTNRAIRVRMDRRGISQRCEEDNLTAAELARQLGINVKRVHIWIRLGLPSRKISRSISAIRLSDLKAFLLAHPEQIDGIAVCELGMVLGHEVASRIQERSLSAKPRRKRTRPVRCLDTGETFPSVREAGRVHYLSYSTIQDAIRRDGRAGGYKWNYLDRCASS